MKRILIWFLALILTSSFYSVAMGSILNDYFGVQLSVNSNGIFNMPWDPIRGQYMHEDWGFDGGPQAPDPGPQYYLSEVFDIEAMYMDFDTESGQLVYSIVTSMPNTGFSQVPWYPGYVFRAGDVRFQVGSELYVVGTHEGFTGNLYHNPVMTYRDAHRGFAERGNPTLSYINYGQEMATTNMQFSYTRYLDQYGNALMESGYGSHRYATYLIEGTISFADLGGAPQDENVTMTLGMSCNNDIATMTSVPEPSTIALLGIGLVGLYGGRRRFLK
ncbi:MAG: hypothetical protein A2W25_01455 [candidate division Zixibacteria bacterium RBG_16_53_22]|nr:MAG: hypothetical protein A2W25_01455 [candidate division Zixibacteria bacterium RBG_16_53_22]